MDTHGELRHADADILCYMGTVSCDAFTLDASQL